jgi:hypothetical protein
LPTGIGRVVARDLPGLGRLRGEIAALGGAGSAGAVHVSRCQ